jgi:hypothetical protein
MVGLTDFISLIENFVATELAQLGEWVATQKLGASGPVANTLSFEHSIGDKKLTLSYKLGLDGTTVVTIAYDVFNWVVSNPQVIAFVQTLVQNWIASHLPPVSNTVANTSSK